MFESTRRLIRALLLLSFAAIPIGALADGPGGILENISNEQARTPLTASQIASFLPSRGKFTFPAPYNTTAFRITNASDCGGSDCVDYVGYNYWRNMNNSVGSNTMYIMIGLHKSRGGQGPNLFQLNKTTGAVTNLGPIFDSTNALSNTSGEGYYFSYYQPTKLWVTRGTQIQLYDVITHKSSFSWDLMQYLKNVDIATASPSIATLANNVRGGASYILWQSHTSNDDLVQSATVETPNGGHLGCIVIHDDTGAVSYYPATAAMDECQIGRGGRWLQIKEGYNNELIDLTTNKQTLLLDKDGAPGHSDMGYGYMVASDNWASQANTMRVWNLATMTNIVAYHNNNWNAAAPNHISWTNARGDIPVSEQHACGDSVLTQNTPDVGEIICFNLNSSGDVMVAAPVLTSFGASGGSWQGTYGQRPKGNMDPTGQYYIWTSNMGGSRLDAFVVSLPTHLLNDPTIANGSAGSIQPQNVSTSSSSTSSTSSSSTPPPDTTPPVISLVNATASSTSATVTWTTDEASDSQVDYGLTSSYGSSTTLDTNLSTTHSQAISNLQSGTTYHYSVKSRDASGNLATSGDMTFTTATPLSTASSSTSSGSTTSGSTSSGSTTSGSTSSGSTSSGSTSGGSTSSGSTSSGSTTSGPTTSVSTSSGSTTSGLTSSGPTTSVSTSSGSTSSGSTSSGSTSSGSTSSGSTSGGSTSSGSTTSGLTSSGPTTSVSTSSGPTSSGPTSSGPTSSGPTTSVSTSSSPTISSPTTISPDSLWDWRHLVQWIRQALGSTTTSPTTTSPATSSPATSSPGSTSSGSTSSGSSSGTSGSSSGSSGSGTTTGSHTASHSFRWWGHWPHWWRR